MTGQWRQRWQRGWQRLWLWLGRRWSRAELVTGGLVLAGLTAFVVLTYLVIVLGGSALSGDSSSPSIALSVLAAAVIALAFDRVQVRLERLVSRALHHGRPVPYDVLRAFSRTVSGPEASEQIPVRMAEVLADGTGAAWAQVWVMLADRPALAASWPPVDLSDLKAAAAQQDPRESTEPGRRVLPVRHGGELLGHLVVQERALAPLTSVEQRLFAGLAGQAGLGLRGVRLRSELERRLAELSVRAEELRSSRQRLVDLQDAERRRLERDIHDGAQQHLVALAVNLRLVQTLSARAPKRAGALLTGQKQAVAEAIATLAQLSQGIYPPLLDRSGLVVALRSAVGTAAVPVEIVTEQREPERYRQEVEAAAYFCCLEAVQNAVKHSRATAIRITLSGTAAGLSITIEDDGDGFDARSAAARAGTGLDNMRDRIESVGGTLTLRSEPSGGTRIQARVA